MSQDKSIRSNAEINRAIANVIATKMHDGTWFKDCIEIARTKNSELSKYSDEKLMELIKKFGLNSLFDKNIYILIEQEVNA